MHRWVCMFLFAYVLFSRCFLCCQNSTTKLNAKSKLDKWRETYKLNYQYLIGHFHSFLLLFYLFIYLFSILWDSCMTSYFVSVSFVLYYVGYSSFSFWFCFISYWIYKFCRKNVVGNCEKFGSSSSLVVNIFHAVWSL